MRPFKAILLLSPLLSLLPTPILAVLADEAYSVDYHHELLGLPLPQTTFFYRPIKDEKGSLLYTLSDVGVLGAVNPGSGVVVWRTLLNETYSLDDAVHISVAREGRFLRGVEGRNAVVSGFGGRVVLWEAGGGRQRWYGSFEGVIRDIEVIEAVDARPSEVLALFEEEGGKMLVRKLDGGNGDVVWEYGEVGNDVPLQVSTNVRNVFVVALKGVRGGYSLKITTLDPVTGRRVDEVVLSGTVDGVEDVLFVGANAAAPIVAWSDKSTGSLRANVLGSKLVQNLHPSTTYSEPVESVVVHAPHVIQSQPHFLVHSRSATHHWAEVYHIDLATGSMTEAYHLPKLPGKGAFSTSSLDANVFFTRHTDDEVILVSSISHAVLGRWPVKAEKDIGAATNMVTDIVQKSATEYAIRSAVLTTEENWTLIRNGVPAWLRTEGLAGAVAAAWAEFPEQQTLAQTLEQEAHSSPLAAYIHRVKRHANELQHLPTYLQELPKRFLNSFLPEDVDKPQEGFATRDNFGFHKIVIVATARGRLYALNAGDHGRILWSAKVFNLAPSESWVVKGIFVDDIKGQAMIKGSAGEYVLLVTASGRILEIGERGAMPPVQSTALVDGDHGKYLLPIRPGGDPGAIRKNEIPKGTLVVQGEDGEVKGLNFLPKDGHSHDGHSHEKHNHDVYYQPVASWSFKPAAGQRIIKLTARPAHDPVASIGRALGDRSVLYKYLDPNLVLVTAVSDATSTAHVYLLDSVSGDLLYSTTHEAVDITQPITSILTENWFAYSLFSEASTSTSTPSPKGYQLFISDLFESPFPNDRGILGSSANFSSLAPTPDADNSFATPHVITQSFIIPEPITHMTVTQTRQGITTRQLLCTLPLSNAIIGLPRTLIDPRRIVARDPTPLDAEEGLFKYEPLIEFNPQLHLTHKRDVIGIKQVLTTPTLLESTGLVVAVGIDVFGTRVSPSLAFDILGKGFGKVSLVGTVVALGLGVGVLAPMVRRKQIDARWKTS